MTNAQEDRQDTPSSQHMGGGGLRTRGVVRTRGFVPIPTSSPSRPRARMRGAIRTRGGPSAPVRGMVAAWPILEDLPTLLRDIRKKHVYDFPLTVVVEDPTADGAKEFREQVRGLLHPRDRVWLLDDGSGAAAGDDYLDLQDACDKVFARTLVADLLFMAAVDREKIEERLAVWKHRARVVILSLSDGAAAPETEVGLPGFRFVWPSRNA